MEPLVLVASCLIHMHSFIHSFTRSFIHVPFIHSFTHSLIHSSFIHSSGMDGPPQAFEAFTFGDWSGRGRSDDDEEDDDDDDDGAPLDAVRAASALLWRMLPQLCSGAC